MLGMEPESRHSIPLTEAEANGISDGTLEVRAEIHWDPPRLIVRSYLHDAGQHRPAGLLVMYPEDPE